MLNVSRSISCVAFWASSIWYPPVPPSLAGRTRLPLAYILLRR
jgi:hypothetical protein